MLILTRKVGDRIMIGDDIVVTIVEVNLKRRNTTLVGVGVSAPKSIKILRQELKHYASTEQDQDPPIDEGFATAPT